VFAILKYQTVADIISISGPLPVKLPKEKSKEEAVESFVRKVVGYKIFMLAK